MRDSWRLCLTSESLRKRIVGTKRELRDAKNEPDERRVGVFRSGDSQTAFAAATDALSAGAVGAIRTCLEDRFRLPVVPKGSFFWILPVLPGVPEIPGAC